MATTRQRILLQQYMGWFISHAPQIHYGAVRPMLTYRRWDGAKKPARFPTYSEVAKIFKDGGSITMDCSESVTLLCKWAGLKDPNGFGFNGYGNSGTMYEHLTKRYTSPGSAHPGAIVVYGPWDHVCMVQTRNNNDPWLFSHGQESGPLHISLAEESAFHSGQARYFLDVSRL